MSLTVTQNVVKYTITVSQDNTELVLQPVISYYINVNNIDGGTP